jgi:predicted nucleic acid-binding protein
LIYVDTSVVVKALDDAHPGQAEAARKSLKTRVEKVVSELFMLEFSAAVSRRTDLLSAVSKSLSVPDSTVAMGYTIFATSKFDLKMLGTSSGPVSTPLGKLSPEVARAMGLAGTLKLRSLDLLHLSYAMVLREEGYPIEAFLTSDREFTKAEGALKQMGIGLQYAGE